MGQLVLSVACGTINPTPAHCDQGSSLFVDADGAGFGILYSDTRALTPCHAITTVTNTPHAFNGTDWGTPHAVPRFPIGLPDAENPAQVTPGAFPLPPHCWGWEGASDFLTTRYYSFEGTLLQIADTANEFAAFDARFLTVTVDYDITTVRRMTQRRLAYFRTDYSTAFDFTTPANDSCTDLESTSATVHHTDVLYTNLQHAGLTETDQWNSLAFHDQRPGNGSTIPNYAFAAVDSQDSSYFNAAVGGGFPPIAGHYGTFSEGYGPFGQTAGGGSLEWDVVYTFGRQTQTTTNVRFTVTSAWHQFHCVPDGGGNPCNCHDDCGPCNGSSVIKTGHCAQVCANSTVADSLVQGWHLYKNGVEIANNGATLGWSVSASTQCSLLICSPCITTAQKNANDYQGPYSIVWGLGTTCVCDGRTHYKTLTATFTIEADVICDSPPPPQVGATPSYDVDFSGRHARTFCTLDSKGDASFVYLGIAPNVFPLVWVDTNTQIVAGRACVRWDRQSHGDFLYILGQLTSSLRLYVSTNSGRSWTLMANVGAGSFPALVIARDGRKLCYFVTAGSTSGTFDISGKWYDGAGAVLKDTFIAIKGVDNQAIAADEGVAGSEWHLTVLYSLSGRLTTKTSIDGVVFTD